MNPSHLRGYIELAKLSMLAKRWTEHAEVCRRVAAQYIEKGRREVADVQYARSDALLDCSEDVGRLTRDTDPAPPDHPDDEPPPDTLRDGALCVCTHEAGDSPCHRED